MREQDLRPDPRRVRILARHRDRGLRDLLHRLHRTPAALHGLDVAFERRTRFDLAEQLDVPGVHRLGAQTPDRVDDLLTLIGRHHWRARLADGKLRRPRQLARRRGRDRQPRARLGCHELLLDVRSRASSAVRFGPGGVAQRVRDEDQHEADRRRDAQAGQHRADPRLRRRRGRGIDPDAIRVAHVTRPLRAGPPAQLMLARRIRIPTGWFHGSPCSSAFLSASAAAGAGLSVGSGRPAHPL
jgi:hypothetical protein